MRKMIGIGGGFAILGVYGYLGYLVSNSVLMTIGAFLAVVFTVATLAGGKRT